MDDVHFFIMMLIIAMIPWIFGIVEKIRNERNLKKLKVRINVNGIRGKSTVTRLTTAILKEAGYRVVGKTTGSAARMIFWNSDEEIIIRRKPMGVSIGEQIQVVHQAAKAGANALVCECMAVNPEYQKILEHQILKGNIVAIVNVLEDHLDQMGPTLEQITWAFGETIPYNGIVVVPECEFTDYFRKIAAERKTRLIAVQLDSVPQDYLNRFPYMVFSDNCAMALGIAQALDIPTEVALRGMLKAAPDPGALTVNEIRAPGLHTWFVNAFAANEPSSSLKIWNSIQGNGINTTEPVMVMNCRPDRVDRSRQFAQDFFPKVGAVHLFVIGESVEPFEKAYREGQLSNLLSYQNLENATVPEIMKALEPYLDGQVLFGVGNIHGICPAFMKAVLELDETDLSATVPELNH